MITETANHGHWEDHCWEALCFYYGVDSTNPEARNEQFLPSSQTILFSWLGELASCKDDLIALVDAVANAGVGANVLSMRAQTIFTKAGLSAAEHLKFERITLGEMQDLLVGKQFDYGHENIASTGVLGLCVRFIDKIARLFNMLSSDPDIARNESLMDTWRDILGYAVIMKMFVEGNFMAQLREGRNHD